MANIDTGDIHVAFYTIKRIEEEGGFQEFLKLLSSYEKIFGIVGYTYKSRYNKMNMRDFDIDMWERNSNNEYERITFGGYRPYLFSLTIAIDSGKIVHGRYEMSAIWITIKNAFFINKSNHYDYSRLEKFLHFCTAIYDFSEPMCGNVHEVIDKDAISVAISKLGMFSFLGITQSMAHGVIQQPHKDCPVDGAFWVNYLGPKCVSFFKMDQISVIPGVIKSERLKDGGLLLFTAPHPFAPDDDVHRQNQLALWKYMGLKPTPKLKVIDRYKKDSWTGCKTVGKKIFD